MVEGAKQRIRTEITESDHPEGRCKEKGESKVPRCVAGARWLLDTHMYRGRTAGQLSPFQELFKHLNPSQSRSDVGISCKRGIMQRFGTNCSILVDMVMSCPPSVCPEHGPEAGR